MFSRAAFRGRMREIWDVFTILDGGNSLNYIDEIDAAECILFQIIIISCSLLIGSKKFDFY